MNFHAFLEPGAWMGLFVLLAAGLAVYLAALSIFTVRRLRHPPRRTYGWGVSHGLPCDPSEISGASRRFESWTFSRGRLEMPVWDIAGDDPAGPVVVVTHGWGGSRLEMLSRVPALAAAASRVVLWDMRGCGEAGGVCTLGGREADDLNALLSVVDAPVVLFGFSLGAEVCLRAAHASSHDLVRGLILEAPYRKGITPARNLLRAANFPSLVNLPVAMVVIGLLNRQSPASRWHDLVPLVPNDLPLLVLHGSADEACPIADGEAIAKAGGDGGKFVRVEGAGHKDVFGGEVAAERVRDFLSVRCHATP